MVAFEHILLLLSFVYALAIAHILTTVARLVGARARVRVSGFHAYWMANAMMILVIDWIDFWDMRNITTWSVVSIAILLASAFGDYLQAALVCPEIPSEGPIDLGAFHKLQSRYYIGASACSSVIALLSNAYYAKSFNIAEYATQNMTIAPMVIGAISAAIFRNRWVQIGVPILLASLWAYNLVRIQDVLQ